MSGSGRQFGSGGSGPFEGPLQSLLSGCIAILMSVIALRLAWIYVQPILPVIAVGTCVIVAAMILMVIIRLMLLRRNRW